MKTPGLIKGSNFLTIVANNKSFTINSDDARYSRALSFVKSKNWDALVGLCDRPAAIAKFLGSNVEVFETEVHHNGKKLHGSVVNRILDFLKEGLPLEPLTMFIDKLASNPYPDVITRLYDFIENNKIALSQTGNLLAFKLVKADGSPPYHAGQFVDDSTGEWVNKYEVGKTYSLPDEKLQKGLGACGSAGLYFGNQNYFGGAFNEAGQYTGDGRMLIVEIDPRDVFNVPYIDASKAVTSRFTIIAEYESVRKEVAGSLYGVEKTIETEASNEEVANSIRSTCKTTPALPARDQFGRFIPKSKRDKSGRFTKRSTNAPKRNAKGRFI